jgi:hypothetical protein
MVNIEDLSEEEQMKYNELQEYIKQWFLSSARKDCSGKVMMTQYFEFEDHVWFEDRWMVASLCDE